MTQADLAAAMSSLTDGPSVSQGYISRAEAGRLAVSGERLEIYAMALRYLPHVLCADPDVQGIGIGLIHHRKRASLGAQALRRIHAELALCRVQVRALVTEAPREERHWFRHIDVDDLETPADAATSVRDEWRLPKGPVAGMVRVIEQAGGWVLIRELATRKLDAVSQWDADEAPLFLLNASAPADRFRFSLAHELGHIIMHGEPGPPAEQEQQADEFASEFLMPAYDIRDELKSEPLTLDRLLALKQRWHASMAAVTRRALTLGAIKEWEYRDLMVEMSVLGYRTQEPGELQPELPDRVSKLITHLQQDLGYSSAQIAHVAGLFPDELDAAYSIT